VGRFPNRPYVWHVNAMGGRYDPALHHRRSIRLRTYDYSQPGAYFVTVCVCERECLLGEVLNDSVILSAAGRVVAECWQWVAQRYAHIELDEWVVMPNHLHGIIVISDRPIPHTHQSSGTTLQRKSLGSLIGAFKTVSTQRVNVMRNCAGQRLWQRDFYEHIIRDESELDRIRQYIADNPARWAMDRENRAAIPHPTTEPWQV
jgi:REP-associated tyrosine transposase